MYYHTVLERRVLHSDVAFHSLPLRSVRIGAIDRKAQPSPLLPCDGDDDKDAFKFTFCIGPFRLVDNVILSASYLEQVQAM